MLAVLKNSWVQVYKSWQIFGFGGAWADQTSSKGHTLLPMTFPELSVELVHPILAENGSVQEHGIEEKCM